MLMIEAIIVCALFFLVCYLGTGTDDKNIKSFAAYPDEVQQLIVKNPVLSEKIPPTQPWRTFWANVLLFSIVFFLCGLLIRAEGFCGYFMQILFLGQVLNLFDFLIIDLLWWRRTERVRFTGTADQPALYQNPRKHWLSFLKGIAAFLIVAVIDGALLTLL